MEEHAGKLWFGICAGRTVPSARLALAGTRITALDKTDTVMECFMDPSVAKNPDPVWAACHAMDMTLTGPRISEDVVPSLPQAIWVEFMGIDEKPDSDDYEIGRRPGRRRLLLQSEPQGRRQPQRIRILRPTPRRLHRQPDGREEIP